MRLSGLASLNMHNLFIDKLQIKFDQILTYFENVEGFSNSLVQLRRLPLFKHSPAPLNTKLVIARGYHYSGYLRFRGVAPTIRNLHGRKATLVLSINPSRFFGAQENIHQFYNRSPNSRELRVSPEVGSRKQSNSLDGKDNFLELPQKMQISNWEPLIESYITGCIIDIASQINQIFTILPNQNEFRGRLQSDLHSGEFASHAYLIFDLGDPKINHLECYHEIETESALSLTRRVARALSARLPLSAEVDYGRPTASQTTPSGRQRFRTRLNAVDFSAPFGPNGVWLVVYAKLPSRMRIEVRYTRSLRTLLRAAPGDIPSDPVEAILALVQLAAQDTTQRLVRLESLQSIDDQSPLPTPTALAMLLQHLHEATGGRTQTFLSILEPLLSNRRITKPDLDGSDPTIHIRRAIDELERRGVLERPRLTPRDNRGVFVPTGHFRQVVERLSTSLFDGHVL